jgi:hypothetical protein
MKSIERRKLKENEFAYTVARTREMMQERQREMMMIGGTAAAVVILVGGFFTYRSWHNDKADTLLAGALSVADASVVVPPPPAPGSPPAGPAARHVPH